MKRQIAENEFKTKSEKCARDIIKYLLKKGLFRDVRIYANNKRFSFKDGNYEDELTMNDVFVEDNINPKNYLEYAGDFLSMSFEGELYDVFNYSFTNRTLEKWQMELENIFEKYGKYSELGNTWNLSLYDL